MLANAPDTNAIWAIHKGAAVSGRTLSPLPSQPVHMDLRKIASEPGLRIALQSRLPQPNACRAALTPDGLSPTWLPMRSPTPTAARLPSSPASPCGLPVHPQHQEEGNGVQGAAEQEAVPARQRGRLRPRLRVPRASPSSGDRGKEDFLLLCAASCQPQRPALESLERAKMLPCSLNQWGWGHGQTGPQEEGISS